MPPASLFTRSLGTGVGDFANVCTVTGTGSPPVFGVQLSIVESASLERVYRVDVKADTEQGSWKRLVPVDKTEKNTRWGVDMLFSAGVATFRVVRTVAGAASPTSLKCKVMAYAGVGRSVAIADSTSTGTAAANVGVYDGALITQVEGRVGINTDAPAHTLDVAGSARITGNVSFGGLSQNATGNAVYFDVATGQLSYGLASAGSQSGLASIEELTQVAVFDQDATSFNVMDADAYANTWISRASAADNDWWAVTYGANTFVAVADSGEGSRVMTSPDGLSWTLRATPADNNWVGVAYGANTFVAVAWSGTGNRVMTSPDGVTWTSRTTPADHDWASVAYGSDKFVAVAFSGTGNRVMSSPDGITWTLRTTPANHDWVSVTYGSNTFVAVASSGTGNRAMTSPDGVTWTLRTTPADNNWRSVTYGVGVFVAVAWSGAGNRVMTSPDGVTWTLRNTPADHAWSSVTFGGGLFAAVAASGATMTSPDGVTWTLRQSAAANEWRGVAYGAGKFAAVSISGTGNRVMTWSPSAMLPSSNVSGVLYYDAGSGRVSYGPLVVDAVMANVGAIQVTSSLTVGGEFTVGGLTIPSIAQSAVVSQTITNGVTTKAPSEDKVFDALALKVDATSVYTKTQLDAGQLDGRYYTETEVNNLLAAKEGTITAAATTTYYRGDKTFQTLNTTAVAEGTNLYYTDARARAATVAQTITDGVTTSAPSQDAVFDALALKSNAADVYTKTQLDAGQLDGRYYTETEVNNLLAAKEGTITAAATTTYYRGDKTFQTLNTTAVAEGTNLYYTDARARAATVAQTITDGVTTSAPSQNAVFDALAGKVNTSNPTMSGSVTISSMPSATTSQIVYYNTSTGQLTRGAASSASGGILQMKTYGPGHLSVISSFTDTNYEYITIVETSFSPVQPGSSRIMVNFDCDYDIEAWGTENFVSQIVEVRGGIEYERMHKVQKFVNAGGGGTRSSTIFPIQGVWTSVSGFATVTIRIKMYRTTEQDAFSMDTNQWSLVITEVQP